MMPKQMTTTLSSRLSFLYARSLHAVSKRLMCLSCSGPNNCKDLMPIRLGLLTSSQCRTLLSIVFLVIGMLLLPKLYFRGHPSLQLRSFAPSTSPSFSSSTSSSSSSPPADINIWYHSSLCKTFNLTSIPSAYSSNHFPYAALRDAVVDRRPPVAHFFAQSNHTHDGGVRILLLVTLHNSARLSREKSIGRVVHDNDESQTVFDVNVEYALHATSFLLRHPTRYKPGTRTVHGRHVTEWHVGLYIRRPDANHHASLAALFDSLFATPSSSSSYHQSTTTTTSAMNLKLKLALNLLRFDGRQIPFMPEMTLACINAWTLPPEIIAHASSTSSSTTTIHTTTSDHTSHSVPCSKSNRAVLISGGALYGKKQVKTEHYKEVAHFAARALTGTVKYDAVLVTVVSAVAMSDRLFSCGQLTGCSARMGERNNDLLNRVGVEIAKEFDKIGIDRALLRRVVLVPICTLGSDAEASEQWNPCSQSKHSGQYWSTTLAYATVSKYYKWAASHDIDEFFAPAPALRDNDSSRQMHSEFAVKAFDNAHTVLGRSRYGGFIMQWLNFKLLSTNDARDLTRRLARSRMPLLEDRVNTSRSRQCYQRLGDNTGKSVVHCDAGLGFTIHHPVLLSRSGRQGMAPSFGFKQGQAMFRGMRTWHARLVSSKGTCHYKAAGEHPLTRMEVEYRRNDHATQRNKAHIHDVAVVDDRRGDRDQDRIGDDDAKLLRGMKSKHI